MRFGWIFGAVLSIVIASGCGGSSTPSSPSPPLTSSPTPAGSWRGTWISAVGGSGTLAATMTQDGNRICGGTANCSMTLTGSPCFASSQVVFGNITGPVITFQVIFLLPNTRDEESPRIDYIGTLSPDGRSLSGQYIVRNGPEAFTQSPCGNDVGTWTAQKE